MRIQVDLRTHTNQTLSMAYRMAPGTEDFWSHARIVLDSFSAMRLQEIAVYGPRTDPSELIVEANTLIAELNQTQLLRAPKFESLVGVPPQDVINVMQEQTRQRENFVMDRIELIPLRRLRVVLDIFASVQRPDRWLRMRAAPNPKLQTFPITPLDIRLFTTQVGFGDLLIPYWSPYSKTIYEAMIDDDPKCLHGGIVLANEYGPELVLGFGPNDYSYEIDKTMFVGAQTWFEHRCPDTAFPTGMLDRTRGRFMRVGFLENPATVSKKVIPGLMQTDFTISAVRFD
jgi:hypothetical protein